MFLCSNMDSPQKTGLDTSQTIPFRGGHPTLISAIITDLAILGVIVRISCFSIQIWTLKNWSRYSQTIPFREGHPIRISAIIIDLAILRATVRILCFSIQIWILLEKWVQIQVEPSKMEVKRPGFHWYFAFSSPISKGTNLGPSDLESPQRVHLLIPISSILSQF